MTTQHIRIFYCDNTKYELSLSHTDRVSKFGMDARLLSVVEIGQYFMTKDTGEQFFAKACREYSSKT